MTPRIEIRYLLNHEIDKGKWNRCIDEAENGSVYPYSFYLDYMSGQWDALVSGDYEAVMPLTWNKKYGIHYLYQPFLTASLGVFGKHVDAGLLQDFLNHIPKKFRYWDICLNQGNLFSLQTFNLYKRMNHVLKLHQQYDDIQHHYRGNVRRSITRAFGSGCTVQKSIGVDQVIELSTEQLRNLSGISADGFTRFRNLYHYLETRNKAVTYGILSARGQLLASGVFLFSHKRAYYILAGNHPDGRTIGASHALIDAFIRDYAHNDICLDFEGSDISRIAFFFKSFGAVEEKYAALRHNRLPPLLRWLKK